MTLESARTNRFVTCSYQSPCLPSLSQQGQILSALAFQHGLGSLAENGDGKAYHQDGHDDTQDQPDDRGKGRKNYGRNGCS